MWRNTSCWKHLSVDFDSLSAPSSRARIEIPRVATIFHYDAVVFTGVMTLLSSGECIITIGNEIYARNFRPYPRSSLSFFGPRQNPACLPLIATMRWGAFVIIFSINFIGVCMCFFMYLSMHWRLYICMCEIYNLAPHSLYINRLRY